VPSGRDGGEGLPANRKVIDINHMPLYKVGHQILESNVALPGLAEADQSTPQHSFFLRQARPAELEEYAWFHHWQDSDQEIWLAFARHAAGYLLRFPNLADFHLSLDTVQIDCYPDANTPLDTIEHLLLDQVLPVVLSRSAGLVAHASAVATPLGAIAFVGRSGRGKSTLAASLALQGFPLMTDDCLLLEEADAGLLATPSYPGARLWDDAIKTLFEHAPAVTDVAHYTHKKRLALADGQVHFCRDRVPLRRMYFLADPAQSTDDTMIAITPLAARAAFMELVAYSFKLEVDDRGVLQREFRLLDRIAALPLFYRLSYPRDFSMLPAVQQTILDHLMKFDNQTRY
jgi:hypothetical protein